jgi:hypothetical protein
MSDLYIENFFHHGTTSLEPELERPSVPIASEESINQVQFLLRVLTEEINKELRDEPPFPLMLKKLENTILTQNKGQTLLILSDLEELLDIKFLSRT